MKVHSKIARVRHWLRWFAERHPQRCVFCGEVVDPKAFLVGDSGDGLTVHHEDENRANNAPENLPLMHRSCHASYHRSTKETS